MRVAVIVALAVALMVGATACMCMERGERWDGHQKMMRCPMCEHMKYCPMCGRMMACPECGQRMGQMGMGMRMGERVEGRQMMRCPMCDPMMDKGGCGGMMGQMGMDAHCQACCRAMMNAKMMPTDPAKLMAMQEHLKLTQEQMDKLMKIQKDAAGQAEEVLDADQKAMIEKMREMPDTMMGMHKMMKDEMMGNEGEEHEMKEGAEGEAK